jgi:CHAD domain-containing protein
VTPRKPARITWNPAKTVAENAREKLPELARQFFTAGRVAAAQDTTTDALHRFRLLTKRFRYTLELFRDYYGDGLERRLDALHTVQQLLGAISDCAATQDLLLARDDLSASERAAFLRKLKRTAAIRVAAFRNHWLANFSEPASERFWTDYLRRFARRKVAG